jgi:hypothetical protein
MAEARAEVVRSRGGGEGPGCGVLWKRRGLGLGVLVEEVKAGVMGCMTHISASLVSLDHALSETSLIFVCVPLFFICHWERCLGICDSSQGIFWFSVGSVGHATLGCF